MPKTIMNRVQKTRVHSVPVFGIFVFLMFLIVGTASGGIDPNTPGPVSPPTPPKGVKVSASEEGSELMMFMDMPVVVSASRTEQPINRSPMPISVIDAEDIHYSGATNVYEVLRYVPGVDVIKVSRTRYAVGVRGFHDFISDRTLTLIDGRAADSPLFGGSEFYRQPVLMEDIKQIEVVRGPGGAAWGANAFNGVINIITKKPEDCLGWFASTTWSEFGDSYNHMRWAERKGKWQWMASVGYEDVKNSGEAIDHPEFTTPYPESIRQLIGFDHYTTRDFIRNERFDGKAIYKASDQAEVSFGTGYSQIEGGDFEFAGFFPHENSHLETSRSFVRVDTRNDEDSFGHLQWFGNFARSNMPMWLVYETRENDLEAEHHFKWGDNHTTTFGGNFRWTNIDTDSKEEQLYCPDEPFNEYWAGAYVMDSWKVTDRLTVEGQLRGDWYSGTQTDWASRLTALYAVDEQKLHIVRFSGAKAFRTPLTQLRETDVERVNIPLPSPPFPPKVWAVNLRNNENVENEETVSVETGYTGRLNPYTILRTDLYYQHYEKLIGYASEDDPLGLNRFLIVPDNIGGADAWGAENELALEGKPGKLSVWYAYNDVRRKHGDNQDIRAYLPAKHKCGLTGRLFLPGDFTLNANYCFDSETLAAFSTNVQSSVEPSHHLDITISKAFLNGRGEIMAGVSDVLENRREPVYGVAQLTAHETPGRMFFARVQWQF